MKVLLNLQDDEMDEEDAIEDQDEDDDGVEDTSMSEEPYLPFPNHQLHLLPKYLVYNILEYMVNIFISDILNPSSCNFLLW